MSPQIASCCLQSRLPRPDGNAAATKVLGRVGQQFIQEPVFKKSGTLHFSFPLFDRLVSSGFDSVAQMVSDTCMYTVRFFPSYHISLRKRSA